MHNLTVEERIKLQLGEQLIQIHAQSVLIEELNTKIKELEKPKTK